MRPKFDSVAFSPQGCQSDGCRRRASTEKMRRCVMSGLAPLAAERRTSEVDPFVQADMLAALPLRRRTCRRSVICASAKPDNRCVVPTKPAQIAQRTWGVRMYLKTFLSLISAMSLAASLACVAAPARADNDGDDRDHGQSRDHGHESRDHDHDHDHDGDHHGRKSPRMVLISLDGAKPDFIQKFIDEGVLPRDGGLARLSRQGAVAVQNGTASPSLPAVSHSAIPTGSTAVHNDIPSNTFEAIVGPISSSLSGFAAPIGGYRENPLGAGPPATTSPPCGAPGAP